MMGHGSYKDICNVGLSKQHASGYSQVQSRVSSTRAFKMGASPELQGPGKILRDGGRKPNTHL